MPISKPRSWATRADKGSNTEPGCTQRSPARMARKRTRRSVQFMRGCSSGDRRGASLCHGPAGMHLRFAKLPCRRKAGRHHGRSSIVFRPSPRAGGEKANERKPPMPMLDRDGVRIHYEVHGEGTPVLLSHGYSATCRMWDGQIAALKDRYKVIVWDMRGHGESDYPTDPGAYSEALTVEDMAALLKACGAQRAVIAGLSLGGYMSLAFHTTHPQLTRAIMLFDTGPGFKK